MKPCRGREIIHYSNIEACMAVNENLTQKRDSLKDSLKTQKTPSEKGEKKEQSLTAKASSALWLSLVSSGLSTGVCRVNLVSNWLTSSSDCCSGTRDGEDGEFNMHVHRTVSIIVFPCLDLLCFLFLQTCTVAYFTQHV